MIQTMTKSRWVVASIADPQNPAKSYRRLGLFESEAEAIMWRDANAPEATVSECLNVYFS